MVTAYLKDKPEAFQFSLPLVQQIEVGHLHVRAADSKYGESYMLYNRSVASKRSS